MKSLLEGAEWTGDVWFKLSDNYDEDEVTHEANTYTVDDQFVVEWYLNTVGLVTRVYFDTLEEAHEWYAREDFQDFSN